VLLQQFPKVHFWGHGRTLTTPEQLQWSR